MYGSLEQLLWEHRGLSVFLRLRAAAGAGPGLQQLLGVGAWVVVIPGMWSQLENKYKNKTQGVLDIFTVKSRDITYSYFI